MRIKKHTVFRACRIALCMLIALSINLPALSSFSFSKVKINTQETKRKSDYILSSNIFPSNDKEILSPNFLAHFKDSSNIKAILSTRKKRKGINHNKSISKSTSLNDSFTASFKSSSFSIPNLKINSSRLVSDGSSSKLIISGVYNDLGVISIFNNNNDSGFGKEATLLAGKDPAQTISVDLNKDGYNDFISIDKKSNKVFVNLYNEEIDSLYSSVNYPTNNSPDLISFGDINNDDLEDIIVSHKVSKSILIYINTGGSTNPLSGPFAFNLDFIPSTLNHADLDQNGTLDLIIGNKKNLHLFLGTGDGDFKELGSIELKGNLTNGDVADLNGDGNLDFIFTYENLKKVGILYSTDKKLFSKLKYHNISGLSKALAVEDINNDGILDITSVQGNPFEVSILEGNQNGFNPSIEYLLKGDDFSSSEISISAKAINDIGERKIVITSNNTGELFILSSTLEEKVKEVASTVEKESWLFARTDFCENGSAKCKNGGVFSCPDPSDTKLCLTSGNTRPVCFGNMTIKEGMCSGANDPICQNGAAVCPTGYMFECPSMDDFQLCLTGAISDPICLGDGTIKEGMCVENGTSSSTSTGGQGCCAPTMGTFSLFGNSINLTFTRVSPINTPTNFPDSLFTINKQFKSNDFQLTTNGVTVTHSLNIFELDESRHGAMNIAVNITINGASGDTDSATKPSCGNNLIREGINTGDGLLGTLTALYENQPANSMACSTSNSTGGNTCSPNAVNNWAYTQDTDRYNIDEFIGSSLAVLVDLNNDNIPDIVRINSHDSTYHIREGMLINSNISWGSETTYNSQTGEDLFDIKIGDLNNDNKEDIILCARNSIAILENNNTLTPSHSLILNGEKGAFGVEIADINNDGSNDLILNGSGKTSSILNDGNGNFNTELILDHSPISGVLALSGDIDNDNYDDCILYHAFEGFKIINGNSDGSLSVGPSLSFELGTSFVWFDKGDFNKDGWLDVALSYNKNAADPNAPLMSGVIVFFNNMNGSFNSGVNYEDNSLIIKDLLTLDVNGDCNLDLAYTAHSSSMGFANKVLLNDGNGSFTVNNNLPDVNYGTYLYKVMLNNDHLDDFIAYDYSVDRKFNVVSYYSGMSNSSSSSSSSSSTGGSSSSSSSTTGGSSSSSTTGGPGDDCLCPDNQIFYMGSCVFDEGIFCPTSVQPVCGCDGMTYSNVCYAGIAGIKSTTPGNCEDNCMCPSGQVYFEQMCQPQTGNEGCFLAVIPVCGCDGMTYSNSCYAGLAGIKSTSMGACSNSSTSGAAMCISSQWVHMVIGASSSTENLVKENVVGMSDETSCTNPTMSWVPENSFVNGEASTESILVEFENPTLVDSITIKETLDAMAVRRITIYDTNFNPVKIFDWSVDFQDTTVCQSAPNLHVTTDKSTVPAKYALVETMSNEHEGIDSIILGCSSEDCRQNTFPCMFDNECCSNNCMLFTGLSEGFCEANTSSSSSTGGSSSSSSSSTGGVQCFSPCEWLTCQEGTNCDFGCDPPPGPGGSCAPHCRCVNNSTSSSSSTGGSSSSSSSSSSTGGSSSSSSSSSSTGGSSSSSSSSSSTGGSSSSSSSSSSTGGSSSSSSSSSTSGCSPTCVDEQLTCPCDNSKTPECPSQYPIRTCNNDGATCCRVNGSSLQCDDNHITCQTKPSTSTSGSCVAFQFSEPEYTMVGAYLFFARSNNAVTSPDYNNDGRVDVTGASTLLSTYFGERDSMLSSPQFSGILAQGNLIDRSFTINDFNGDGNLDLISTSHTYDHGINSQNPPPEGTIKLNYGTGNGDFIPSHTLPTSPFSKVINSGDFNGDGKIDIVTLSDPVFYTYQFDNNGFPVNLFSGLTTHINNGTSFSNGIQSFVSAYPKDLTVADFNNDGLDDVAVVSSYYEYNDNNITILKGNVNGRLTNRQTINIMSCPKFIRSGDLNGDSLIDLVAINTHGKLSIVLADSTSDFKDPEYTTRFIGQVKGLELKDLNNDDNLDIVILYNNPEVVYILPGKGDGKFTEGIKIEYDKNATNDFAIYDLNNDEYPEIITSHNDTRYETDMFGLPTGMIIHEYFYSILENSSCNMGALPPLPNNNTSMCGAVTNTCTTNPREDWSFKFTEIMTREYLGSPVNALPIDLNNDNKNDFVIGVVSYSYDSNSSTSYSSSQIESYLNDGMGNYELMGSTYFGNNIGDFSILAHDIDGDNKDDVIIPNGLADIEALISQGDGNLTVENGASGHSAYGNKIFASEDLNCDNADDYIVINNQTINVLLNKDGFEKKRYCPGDITKLPAIGDFNKENGKDLIATGYGNKLGYFKNNGEGDFEEYERLDLDFTPHHAAALDLNNDGNLDLAVVGNPRFDDQQNINIPENFHIIYGMGMDGFDLNNLDSTLYEGLYLTYIDVADINGDCKEDLVLTGKESNTPIIVILINDKVGGFEDPIIYGFGEENQSDDHNFSVHSNHTVRVADFNKDNHIDLIVTVPDVKKVYLLENIDIGDLQSNRCTPRSMSWNLANNSIDIDQPTEAIFGDINGDDYADIYIKGKNASFNDSLFTYLGAEDAMLITGEVSDFFLNNYDSIASKKYSSNLTIGNGVDDLLVFRGSSNLSQYYTPANNGDIGSPRNIFFGGLYKPLIEDFEENDKNDFLVANSNRVVYYPNSGSDAYETRFNTSVQEIASGDLNIDSKIDFVATSTSNNTITFYENTPPIGWNSSSYTPLPFGKYIRVPTSEKPRLVTTGHLNNDDFIDVVVVERKDGDPNTGTNNNDFIVTTYINKGYGRLEKKHTFTTSDEIKRISTADFNGDCLNDIVVSKEDEIAIYEMNTDGTLKAPRVFAGESPSYNESRFLDDINGDGYPDAVLIDKTNNKVNVYLNE